MKQLMYNPYYSLIEFGFFVVIGTAAGSAGLLWLKLKKKFYANIAEEQRQTEFDV